MNMKPTTFLLLSVFAVFVGTLAALAVAGKYAKSEVDASLAAANQTPAGKLLGLFN